MTKSIAGTVPPRPVMSVRSAAMAKNPRGTNSNTLATKSAREYTSNRKSAMSANCSMARPSGTGRNANGTRLP